MYDMVGIRSVRLAGGKKAWERAKRKQEENLKRREKIGAKLKEKLMDCDVLGGQNNQRTIRGVCYDGTQGENAKVGEKGRLVFSVRGMIEKKENGIWEKDNAEVQFLGGAAVFAARSIVKPRQLFAQQVMKDALLAWKA
ncbi:hypothetical protein SADUNF_Sadunf02G0017900 [Salix dunnii]|uniref:Uncharacterized protein n=1 Tax=Salix dunnii TaxID=1413687 RepID=A0A835N5Q9_9ROSI|nr:hypothetical protein SADUNF_Sadunf02G0017900 [Salix dunnii]